MQIKTFVVPPLENNNYLVYDEESKEAVLIDCSHFDERIVAYLKENGLTLKSILLTHAHFDHVLGVEKMVQATGAKVFLHKDDESLLKDLNSYTFMMGMPAVNVPEVDTFTEEGDSIDLGTLQIKVIHTPGHTRGGVSYFVDGNLFSGDTLFRESIGRTDLEGGSFKTLEKSIREKIYILPDDTKVYAGHGPSTEVGHEKKFNSYI